MKGPCHGGYANDVQIEKRMENMCMFEALFDIAKQIQDLYEDMRRKKDDDAENLRTWAA